MLIFEYGLVILTSKIEYIKETMKTNQKSPEIIEIPVDPEEEKIFNWVNSDNCLGSWMPSEKSSINEKTKYQFSQAITRYQIKNNLEEREIANKLGLDKNTTARLLRGYVENFSLDSLINYVEKLHLPLRIKVSEIKRLDGSLL